MSSGSIALIGHPNVGKSVLFQRLTGRYANVSNYPGTTVEVTRGAAQFQPGVAIIDTPGVASLPASSEDEQVTARVLLQGPLQAIGQVGDAKNLRRTLLLTTQLAEMGLPMARALNMMDEARSRGVSIDSAALAALLGVFSSLAGLYLSYYADVASGAAIVLVATALFVLAFFFAPRRGLVWRRATSRPTPGVP